MFQMRGAVGRRARRQHRESPRPACHGTRSCAGGSSRSPTGGAEVHEPPGRPRLGSRPSSALLLFRRRRRPPPPLPRGCRERRTRWTLTHRRRCRRRCRGTGGSFLWTVAGRRPLRGPQLCASGRGSPTRRPTAVAWLSALRREEPLLRGPRGGNTRSMPSLDGRGVELLLRRVGRRTLLHRRHRKALLLRCPRGGNTWSMLSPDCRGERLLQRCPRGGGKTWSMPSPDCRGEKLLSRAAGRRTLLHPLRRKALLLRCTRRDNTWSMPSPDCHEEKFLSRAEKERRQAASNRRREKSPRTPKANAEGEVLPMTAHSLPPVPEAKTVNGPRGRRPVSAPGALRSKEQPGTRRPSGRPRS